MITLSTVLLMILFSTNDSINSIVIPCNQEHHGVMVNDEWYYLLVNDGEA